MNKITTIGITSPCGGNGCTTLAVHLAWQASQIRGIRTLAVSMDRTGALLRQFLPDCGLRVDSVFRTLPNLDVCYFALEGAVSKLLPTLGLSKANHPALIVVDLGCGMSSDLLEDMDLWLTPVADLRTMRALLDTGYPRSGQAKTYIAYNRAGGSQYAKRLLAESGDRCSDLSILRNEIPHSGAVQRASLDYKTVWQHSSESRAAVMLKSWADEVLDLAMPRKLAVAKSRLPKVPGVGLLADELLRIDQNFVEEQAHKLEETLRKPDDRICPVCKKTSLRGRQQICSTKCRSKSYREKHGPSGRPTNPAEHPAPTMDSSEALRLLLEQQRKISDGTLRTGKWLRGERKRLGLSERKTAKLLGITDWSLRTLGDNHVVPTAWMSVLAVLGFRVTNGIADVEPVAEPPAADRQDVWRSPPALELLPIVEPAAEPLAGLAALDIEIQEPQKPIEQEVVPVSGGDRQRLLELQVVLDDQDVSATDQLVPIKALSIRRSTLKTQPKAEQVEPRKSRPLSNIEALQERIDAANANLIAASQNLGRPTHRKPLST